MRSECNAFLRTNAGVLNAARRLREIAAVPQPAFDPPSACSAVSSTLGRQNRWSSFDDPSHVPAEVDEIDDHIRRVMDGDFAANPSDNTHAHALPSTLERAVRWVSTYRSSVPEMREEIADLLIEVADSPALRAATAEAFRLYAPPHVHAHCSRKVGGTPHAAFVVATQIAFSFSDSLLGAELVVGMPAEGLIEATGNWRPKESPAACPLTPELCRSWNAELLTQLASAKEATHDRASYTKTLEECKEGTMRGPFTLDEIRAKYEDHFLLIPRHGVLQKGDVRPCDDASRCGLNDSIHMMEALRCIAPDWPARVVRALAQYLPHDDSWHPLLAVDDVAKAFRQVPCAQDWFTVVALRNPHNGRTECFTMGGFNFGNAAAPNQFNRVSHHMAHASQHLLGALSSCYYDDVPSLEPSFALGELETRGDEAHSFESSLASPFFYHLHGTHRGSSQWAVGLVAFLCGFPFARKKRKFPLTLQVFLGVVSDFRSFGRSGMVKMYVSKERRAQITETIRHALSQGFLPAAAISSLTGKLAFVTAWVAWRYGRAAMQPLFAAAKASGTRVLNASVRVALTFFLSTLPLLPEHVIHTFDKDAVRRQPRVYVWTDACYEADSLTRPAGLGIVLLVAAHYRPDGSHCPHKWFYAEGNCPSSFIDRFCLPRKQRIGELELLAAVCAYLTFPALLKGARVIHWIDNTGALAALIKGYARASDLAKIVHAFAATNLGLQCEVWFEYVRSKANIADLPSRGEFGLLHSLGASRVDLVLPLPQWWESPEAYVHAARVGAAHHATSAKRSRPAPTNTKVETRPRRRSYASARRSPSSPPIR